VAFSSPWRHLASHVLEINMPFSVIVNAAWKPDYQIRLEISNCAEVLSGAQPGFSRMHRFRESKFKRRMSIWRLQASITLSEISPEIGFNNVFPRKGELNRICRQANRRGRPGPSEIGIYTRNDPSMQIIIEISEIPLIPSILQNRGLFHILFSE